MFKAEEMARYHISTSEVCFPQRRELPIQSYRSFSLFR